MTDPDSLESEDDLGVNTRRGWAKLPITQAEAKGTREALEATFAALLEACSRSSDPKVAHLAGKLVAQQMVYEMFLRSEHGKNLPPGVATYAYRKEPK